MNSNLFLLLILCAFWPAAAMRISWGLKAGPNISSWYGAKAVNDKIIADNPYLYREAKPGIDMNLFFDLRLTKALSIGPEAMLTQKGYRANYENRATNLTYEEITRIGYVEIPILAKFNITKNKFVLVQLYTGPSFAFRTSISGKFTIENEFNYESDEYSSELIDFLNELFHKQDYSLNYGSMFLFGRGHTRFIVDTRFIQGLSNVWTSKAPLLQKATVNQNYSLFDKINEMDLPKHKNFGIHFMIGFAYIF